MTSYPAGDPGRELHTGTIAVYGGRILAVGRLEEVKRVVESSGLDGSAFATVDAGGGVVTPGLLDPHTHLLFAGARVSELRLRQRGAGYLEILEAGGGILSTVATTREATIESLAQHGRRWLDEMLGHGVTTSEVKSGYGLDTETELRLLEVTARLATEGPTELVPTFLGAHAVPREFRDQVGGTAAYVRTVIREQLPAVAAQGVAKFCDVFCERGVFTPEESRAILEAGRRLGLEPRLHADELEASGGAELAAELRAASADHLGAVTDRGINALARAADAGEAVVATLLPATTLFLMSDRYAPARTLIDAGVPVALGTDFNPGTSPAPSLPLVMSLGCLKLKMTPAETLAAVTINAARALRLEETHGSLEPGKQADLVIWNVASHEEIPYWLGARLVRTVIKQGQVVRDGRGL